MSAPQPHERRRDGAAHFLPRLLLPAPPPPPPPPAPRCCSSRCCASRCPAPVAEPPPPPPPPPRPPPARAAAALACGVLCTSAARAARSRACSSKPLSKYDMGPGQCCARRAPSEGDATSAAADVAAERRSRSIACALFRAIFAWSACGSATGARVAGGGPAGAAALRSEFAMALCRSGSSCTTTSSSSCCASRCCASRCCAARCCASRCCAAYGFNTGLVSKVQM